MINKEIHESLEPAETSQSRFSDISAGNISKAEASRFWENIFQEKKTESEYGLSESELFDRTRGCWVGDFKFELQPDEKLQALLECFHEEKWNNMDETEQKELIGELVNKIGDELELEDIPEILFYEATYGDYGYYNESSNMIGINTNPIVDSKELVDTIAHEMRHAYQKMRAEKLETKSDELYKYSFENYISPDYDERGKCVNFLDYQDQLVEAEARAYAKVYTAYMEAIR